MTSTKLVRNKLVNFDLELFFTESLRKLQGT